MYVYEYILFLKINSGGLPCGSNGITSAYCQVLGVFRAKYLPILPFILEKAPWVAGLNWADGGLEELLPGFNHEVPIFNHIYPGWPSIAVAEYPHLNRAIYCSTLKLALPT